MSLFHRGTHDLEMIREEHSHTGGSDQGTPGKNVIDISGLQAVKTITSGTNTYVAWAVIGSSTADPVWRALKIDESSGTQITWADGDSKFDNIADNLETLTYI